jgi:hypothetical protein
MTTLLKIKAGAPGENIYTADEIVEVYDSFGIQEEFVEKLSLKRDGSPAEMPYQLGNEDRNPLISKTLISALDDDDVEDDDEDDDIDLDLDEDDVDDADLEDVADVEEDDDLDLDLEDDDEDDDDDLV